MLVHFHRCDLCGLPCDHECRYTVKMKRYFNGAHGAEIGPVKLDVCEDCQKKIIEFIHERWKN